MHTTFKAAFAADRGALGALIALAALAWAYLFVVRAGMSVAMPMTGAWSAADFAAMLVMWAVMMIAMMLPSVAPMVVLYSGTLRRRLPPDGAGHRVAAFVAGYLLAWGGFAIVATLANWALHRQGLMSSMMGSAAPQIGGSMLIAAGLYQWTPLKDACLAQCRSPVGYLADHWREGSGGALLMGLGHGAYCIGCCWLVMALLFVLGVMNIAWIAVLTAFVLAEKLGPAGRALGRVTGTLLVAWGVWLVSAT